MRTISARNQYRHHAFALRDLLVLLACLCLLALIQLPVLGHNKDRSRLTQCLSNYQQLGRAWLMYAEDNGGKLVWNPDGGDSGKVPTKPSWAGGWLDFSGGNRDNTNTALLTGYNPYGTNYGGLLGKYLISTSVFRCPEDPVSVTSFGESYPRVRSTSMNAYMSGRRADGSLNSWAHLPFRIFQTVNDFARLKPASAFVFIDEREDSINDSVFSMELAGFLDANDNVVPGQSAQIIDRPADWHDGGAGISFADGHAEFWRWTDPRVAPVRTGLLPGNTTIGYPDMPRLSKAASSH